MTKKTERYRYADVMRAFLCASVLLYHLGILKGGYLSVCGFFVLSGFFTCRSVTAEGFSLGKYWLGRIRKIWLPLAVTVLVTVSAYSLLGRGTWVTLRPESTSVLFGYNNFWQIASNSDYFARNDSSPFTHMWYIAILLQFEVFFPLLMTGLKKITEDRNVLYKVMLVLSLVFTAVFVKMSLTEELSTVYYSTLSRMFSLFIGAAAYLGRERKGGKGYVLRAPAARKVFLFLVILMTGAEIFILPSSKLFMAAMTAYTVFSAMMLRAGMSAEGTKIRTVNLSAAVSSMSYEIYLVQYPVMALSGYLWVFSFGGILSAAAVILLTLILSYMLHAVLAFRGKSLLKTGLALVFSFLCVFGGWKYVSAPDMTEDLAILQSEISENEAEMLTKQEEYRQRMMNESAEWEETLKAMAGDPDAFAAYIKSMPITVIGDSIMAGAYDVFSETFTNCYCDAVVGRTIIDADRALAQLEEEGMIAPTVIIHIGTNGDGPDEYKEQVMTHLEGKVVFWVGCTNSWYYHVNERYRELAEKYDNCYYIDWEAVGKDRSEYYYDGLHLNDDGKRVYTDFIYECVCESYKDYFSRHHDDIVAAHEKEERERITFIGDQALAGMYPVLSAAYPTGRFTAGADTGYREARDILKASRKEGKLTSRIVLVFGPDTDMTASRYRDLARLSKGSSVYIVTFGENGAAERAASKDNVILIDGTQILLSDPAYLSADGIHPTKEGYAALGAYVSEILGN